MENNSVSQGVIYVEQPDITKHNVLFGIADGVFYHHVTAQYELNFAAKAAFAKAENTPVLTTELNSEGIYTQLVADISQRLGVDASTVGLINVCFLDYERSETAFIDELQEFLATGVNNNERDNNERLYVFGSYYLYANAVGANDSIVSYKGVPIHRQVTDDNATTGHKGTVVLRSLFENIKPLSLDIQANSQKFYDYFKALADKT